MRFLPIRNLNKGFRKGKPGIATGLSASAPPAGVEYFLNISYLWNCCNKIEKCNKIETVEPFPLSQI